MFKKFIEWLTARSVQQIFNVVIDNGIYTHISSKNSSQLMCMALNLAHQQKLITKTELLKAKTEIRKYLGDNCGFLETFLRENGYYSSYPVRKNIYKNWDTRPKFKPLR